MKVNNNIQHYGVGFKENILINRLSHVDDKFKKGQQVSNPNSQIILNPSVNNIYTPKQLLIAYANPTYVKMLMNSNPNVQEILKNNGLDGKIYPEHILNIANSHITTTQSYALQIANNMNISPLDKKILEKACVFHDFGKILIPKEIVSKPTDLNPDEKKIMDLHADLGAELLKPTGMDNRVITLVKNHHMPLKDNADILGQILSVADIYSALREQRSYKQALPVKEALKVLDQKAKEGEVSAEVVKALKNSVVESYVA